MLAYEDLPISGQFEESEYDTRAQLLKDLNADEYFLDDKVDWNQDDSGIWLWKATDSSLQLDSSEEHHSGASDFDVPPLAAFQDSPSPRSPHSTHISKHRAPEPYRDLCYYDQSQADAVAIHDSHETLPVHSAGLDMRQASAPFGLQTSQDRITSSAFSSQSGLDVEVICDLEDDVGLPLNEDEEDVIMGEMSAVGDSEGAFSIWEDW